MRTYTIFAGVNGAGKTSIYYNENKYEKRINTDEMVARIGSWKEYNKEYKVCKRKWFLYSYELCRYKEPRSC